MPDPLDARIPLMHSGMSIALRDTYGADDDIVVPLEYGGVSCKANALGNLPAHARVPLLYGGLTLSPVDIAAVGSPSWVPAGAKVHLDFIGGSPQGRAWVQGVGEVAIDTLLIGAVLDSGGLLFTGDGAVVTATPALLTAFQLPYSAVFDQNYSAGQNLSDQTAIIYGIDSNHHGNVSGHETSITTDDYDTQYLAADPAIPNTAKSGKIAFTISNTKVAVSVNGDPTTSDVSQTLNFGSVTEVGIWSWPGFGQVAVGHVRSITIYPVKSDSELSQLSSVVYTYPDWVPDNAAIHIDLVGGAPQGRAWIRGTGEVAIDTLLGGDPATPTIWGSPSGYDPAFLTTDGYAFPTPSFLPLAIIGSALSGILADVTLTLKAKQLTDLSNTLSFVMSSNNGAEAIEVDMVYNLLPPPHTEVSIRSYGGTLTNIYSPIGNAGIGVLNNIATTLTGSRADIAVSGSVAHSNVVTTDDRPPGIFTVCFIDAPAYALQSITLYDSLPTTEGLSELSVVT